MTQIRASSPFDAAASGRQRRMGLIQEDGQPNAAAIAVVARVHAGMLFDDLCDYGDDEGQPLSTATRLSRLLETAEPRQVLLSICYAYDKLHRPLPELIWWISGSMEIVPLFVKGFVESLKNILNQRS